MRQPLRSLRRRRERGRQRVALVTAGSAAGATALAATFGAVLAAGQAPHAEATTTAPVSGAAAPVDQVAVDKAVRQQLAAQPHPTPTSIAPPPRHIAPVASAAKAPPATRQPERLKPAERAPRSTAKSTAHAPTGAS
ncbi:MAG: hypothetical protein J2P19_09395 [Pseudonocardia sp.]|nr:hypothetical protein [Pseudonocardia sp.]